jgi:hypothetical protein
MPIDRTTRATRRQWFLLAGLLAVLVGILVYRGRAQTNVPVLQSNPVGRRTPAAKGTNRIAPQDLNVRLDELAAAKQEPQESERNPFRFQERRTEPPKAGGAGAQPPTPVEPAPPSGPPPSPPIPLKFIGVVESPQAGKVAALTDGRNVFHGREGDIIEGRYRIVKIGVESIVVENADGTGRQTIRLSGS